MKKRLIYIIALIACMGCNDWLDVKPRTEMKEEVMFQTEDGFKEALIGAYIQLASEDLYGKNTSMYFTDLVGNVFYPEQSTAKVEYNVTKWQYENAEVEALIEKIWKAYYRCIVHLNDILGHIDAAEAIFSYGNYELIKGEALGLRGFLHLELLRLFGPIPDETANAKAAIPYAEVMSKDPRQFQTLTYRQVCEKIIRDLNAAEELLKNDPIVHSEASYLNMPNHYIWNGDYKENKPQDEWQYYRQVRFNYYAVKGTKARFYHWMGDRENALEYAKEVIEAEKFRLTNERDYTDAYSDFKANLVMLSEHLFGVDVPKLQDIVRPLFKDEQALLQMYYPSYYLAPVYENNNNDVRYKPGESRYWTVTTSYPPKCYFKKYTGNDKIETSNRVPLLRLAEMYLIMIEDSKPGMADNYWHDYILARGLPESLQETLTSETTVLSRAEKEYLKEFIGEGQMFFFYKKHKAEKMTSSTTVKVSDMAIYEIPRPQSQTVFD